MLKVLIAAGLVACASAAGAQSLTTDHVAALDANADGAVSKEELIAAMDASFQQLDTDKNGSLSEAEAVVVIPVDKFRAADKSANGQLSKDEFIAVVIADFDAADKNGDGTLN